MQFIRNSIFISICTHMRTSLALTRINVIGNAFKIVHCTHKSKIQDDQEAAKLFINKIHSH